MANHSSKKQKKTTAKNDDVVIVDTARPSLFANKKLLIISGVAIILLAGILAYAKSSNRENADVTKPISSAAAKDLQRDELKNELRQTDLAPSTKASKQRSYAYMLAEQKQYKEATATFEDSLKLSQTDVRYEDYYYLASWYCQLKDAKSASVVLDKVLAALPAKDNPDEGYYRQELVDKVERFRKECAQ